MNPLSRGHEGNGEGQRARSIKTPKLMEIPCPSGGDAPIVDAGPSSRPARPVKEQEINEMNSEPKYRFLPS